MQLAASNLRVVTFQSPFGPWQSDIVVPEPTDLAEQAALRIRVPSKHLRHDRVLALVGSDAPPGSRRRSGST